MGVSVDWLLGGVQPEYVEPRIISFDADDPDLRRDFEEHERRDAFVPVRILSDPVSLGPGRRVSEGATSGYALIYDVALPRIAKTQKRADEKIVCVWANGNSMEPTIQNRALVAIDLRVDKASDIENRKIYAVWIKDEGITLKRLIKSNDNLILVADNQEAKDFPMVLVGEDADRAVRGKVVWWWSRQE